MSKKRKPLNSKRRIKALEEGNSTVDGLGKTGKGNQDHITFVRKNKAAVFTNKKKERDKKLCREDENNED